MALTAEQIEEQRRRAEEIANASVNGHRPAPSGKTLADVDKVFGKWLLLRDYRAQHGILAAVAAHRAGGESVWVFVVDAPGSGKTETIRGLNGLDKVFPLSSLTPATFASGWKVGDQAKDPSLLLRLPPECIITLKDFTTVLSMHRDGRQEVLAQLRELADGSYIKEFGNGKTVRWEGRMSFISGVTPAIDSHWAVNQTLGERFIQIRPEAPDPLLVADRVMENVGSEEQMRSEIQAVVTDFITGLDCPPINEITVAPAMKTRLKHLATFACRARSAVERDGYAKEISYIPVPEGPARLAKQLSTLARGRAIIDGTTEISEASFREVVEIGLDCIPPHRRAVLDALVAGGELPTPEVTEATRYPVNTARRILEELVAIGMVERRTSNSLYYWRLSEQAEKWRICI